MTDLVLADCFLPESSVKQGFFDDINEGTPAAGLVISVSNDGEHKSKENLTFISYDSACMSCNISSGCVLKVCAYFCSIKRAVFVKITYKTRSVFLVLFSIETTIILYTLMKIIARHSAPMMA